MVTRRWFYRRGTEGLQHIGSYERGLFITAVEMLFSLLAYLMLLGGLLALGYFYSSRWFENREKERKAQETELVYNAIMEDILPLPHTSEQAVWKRLPCSHMPENPFSVKGIFGNRL